jgi:hypothetical protein
MRDQVAECPDVALESVEFDPCLGILVNLLVTLGEPGDEAFGNGVDFEAMEVVVDLIADGPEALGEFVAVIFLGEPDRSVHGLRLEGLPSAFLGIESGIEDDAVGM